MALAETNVQLYMEGLCKVATKGNVVVHFAWFANRMELVCTKCQQTLTAAKPEDTTVDYAVQEFLKLHLHKIHPEYCQCEQCITIAQTKVAVKPKPVTLDFKPVAGPTVEEVNQMTGKEYSSYYLENELLKKPDAVVMTNIKAPDPDGYGLTNLPKIKEPQQNTDKDAGKIAQVLNTFKGEYAAKLNDVALANKIKLLQLSSQDKATLDAAKQKLAAAQEAFKEQAKFVTAEDGIYYSKETVDQLKATLNGYGYKKPLPVQHMPYVPPKPAPPTPAQKKEQPLRQAVGRKIR